MPTPQSQVNIGRHAEAYKANKASGEGEDDGGAKKRAGGDGAGGGVKKRKAA